MFDDDWGIGAVARHKNDEVDKLIRLAAPRERFVLGALVLFMLAAVAAASFFGVNRSLSLDGEFYRAEAGAGGSWQASLPAAPAVVRQIEPGMAARIEIATPSGDTLVLPGEVLAPGPSAEALRIAIAADTRAVPAGVLNPSLADGSPCRVIIPLGRQSIVRALAS